MSAVVDSASDVIIADLFQKVLESIATAKECEKYIEKISDGKIKLIERELGVQVFKGIDKLAAIMEVNTDTHPFNEGKSKWNPLERRFKYEEFEVYQLSERNGEFA